MKEKNTFFFKFILFTIFASLLIVLFCTYICMSIKAPINDYNNAGNEQPISGKKYHGIVIDAGHGGEDGGTSSKFGIYEKDLNLDISLMLCDMFRACGIDVILTRNDDRLLYDRNIDFKGRKKMLDLAARLGIAEKNPDCLFLSIHMNSFTDPKYSGLQVWYSKNNPESEYMADKIQSNARKYLQPENDRKTKAAGSNIYLLHRASVPSVLIECGFLSNPDEAKKLEDQEYRRQIALVIFVSMMEFLESENDLK